MVLDKEDHWNLHQSKLYEEFRELDNAIDEGDNIHIAEETLDVIQVAIGVLDKLHHEGIDVQQAIHRHNKKLINRGWKHKAVIKIHVNKK